MYSNTTSFSVVYAGCQDPMMRETQFCINRGRFLTGDELIWLWSGSYDTDTDTLGFTISNLTDGWIVSQMSSHYFSTGSQWQSNIRVTQISAALAVSFSPDSRCEKYTVLVQCDSFQQKVQHVNRVSRRPGECSHTASTPLMWPRTLELWFFIKTHCSLFPNLLFTPVLFFFFYY